MRGVLLFFCLTIFLAGAARAQDQENKLVDRLLRPDMSLANSAQNKKFIAVEGTSIDKKFAAKSFYSGEQRPAKSFWGIKDFFARQFGTKKFSRSEAAANAVANAESAYASTEFVGKKSSLVRTAREDGKSAPTRDYAESRPFLGKGTRQEILSRQDHPLTIDEVRELLNKNE